ncbi:RHS repeat-associated core domain-containing protein [Thermopirellula anaerolimosa]
MASLQLPVRRLWDHLVEHVRGKRLGHGLRHRTLRLEPLEKRELLSVVASISVDQALQVDREEGVSTFTITITDCPPNIAYGVVNFQVAGTADSCDYTASGFLTSGYIQFYGNGSQSARITIRNDAWFEGNEDVTVRLTGGWYTTSQCCGTYPVTLGTPSEATVTIEDDDEWTISLAATDNLAAEPDNPGAFRITRSGPPGESMDTTYPIRAWFDIGGTARQGDDYQPLPGVEWQGCQYSSTGYVTFEGDTTEILFDVAVIDDHQAEVKEKVALTLTSAQALGEMPAGYPFGNRSDVVDLHDNDWVIEAAGNAVEPDKPLPEPTSGLESDMQGSPGKFRIRLLDGNENFQQATVAFSAAGTAALDDDAHWDDEPVQRDYIADADGFLKGEAANVISQPTMLSIPAGQNSYFVTLVPWYDGYRNEYNPYETVVGTITGWNVDQEYDTATLQIEEPEETLKPCVGCCGSDASCISISSGVTVPVGGLGLTNSGTPLTYYAHLASGRETVIATSPLEPTNGFATLERVEAKLTQFGNTTPNTTIWFDGTEAAAHRSYAFAFPVDVTELSTGAYPWTVQLIQHYSDQSTQTITLSGRKNVINTLPSYMAPGWFAFGVARLIPDGPDVLLLRGGMQRFVPDGAGGWIHQTSDDTSAYTLTGNWGSGFQLRAKDRTLDQFAPSGLLTSSTDPAGNTTTYLYDALNRLVAVDAPEGDTIFAYDPVTGWLSQLTRPDGVVSTYTHDAQGRITQITKPDPDGEGPLPAPVTTFEYGGPNNLLSAVVYPDGSREEFFYDHALRLKRVVRADGTQEEYVSIPAAALVDTSTGQGSQENPAPLREFGQLEATQTTAGVTTTAEVDRWGFPQQALDGEGHATRYVRNAAGQVVQVIEPDPDGPGPLTSAVTSYEYDHKGNRIKMVLPDGGVRRWEYDYTWNAVTKHVDERGITTLYTIDPQTGYVLQTRVVVGQVDSPSNGQTDDVVTTYTYTDASDNTLIGLVETETDALGTVTRYQYNARGQVTRITYAEGTDLEASVQYEYDSGGRRTAEIDELGRRTEYQYDALGRVVRKILPDPDGEGPLTSPVYEYGYDAAGNLVAETDPLGHVTEYAYDARGRLVRTIQPDPDGPAGPLTSPVTQQFYDAAGRVSHVIDPVGTITEYAYDNADRQTATYLGSVIDDATAGYAEPSGTWADWPAGFDGHARIHGTVTGDPTATATWTFSHLLVGMEYEVYVTWQADPANAADAPLAVYAGDTSGQPLATLTVDQTHDPQEAGPGRRFADHSFFKLGSFTLSTPTLIVQLANHSATAGRSVVADAVLLRLASPLSQTVYDDASRVTSTIDALGNVTSYQYDAAGRQTHIIQPDPDGEGPLEAPVTQYVYNIGGQLIQTIDPLGRVTAYEYDALGRRSKVILPDPDGSGPLTSPETRYEYDKLGRVVKVTDPLGNVTEYEYDARGRQIRVTQPDPDGSGPLEAPVTQYTYDAAGQLLQVTDPLGRVTTYEYDGLGRQTKITQPDPDGEGEELAPWTVFTYDAAGRLLTQADRLGHTTTFQYDALGRLISQIDANGAETTYTYDPAGRRLSLTDPVGNTTTWTYDPLGRAVAETNELGDTRYFVYNAAGYLLRQLDRLGRVRQFQYDNLGRNTAEIWYNNVADADADQNRVGTISFTYDGAGQMVSVSDWAAQYSYTYDNLGRITQIAHTITGLTPTVTFSQVYDAAGRRTRLAATLNGTRDFKNRYFYDNLGRVTYITQTSQSGGNPVATKWVSFSYDAAGQVTELTRYADLAGTQLVAQSDYTYDQAGRLRNVSHSQGQTTFVAYTWNFDAANRMTQYINSVDGTTDYTSDATGQLTAADYDYQSDESYQYDSNGNRVTANGSTYTTGTNNQLLSDGTYRYQYDAEGNRTYRFIDNNANGQLDQGDTDITKYNWDHRNRLYKVQHQASYAAAVDWVVRYFYDSENRLVRRLEDSNGDGDYEGKRVFLYDGNQIVLDLERTGAGNVQAGDLRWRYLWGPVVDQILAEENVDNGANETVQWTLTDHLNTVRDIAKYNSQTGVTTVVNHLVYDAFGNVTSETNPAVDSLFLFTARPFDPDTGLQNNLNRWYDSRIGRWMSEDPLEDDLNLYSYVRNNPVFYVDPNGLACSAAVYTSPVLGTGFNHTCIQVERDEVRNILDHYECVLEWREVVPPTRYYDEFGRLWEKPGQRGLFPVLIPVYRQTLLHVTYAIELTRGPFSGALGPNGSILATGPISTTVGNLPGAGWAIVMREGACVGTRHEISPGNVDPCALVQSLIVQAILVAQQANGRPYYVFGPGGEWLGDAANTCNSVTWQILTGAGIQIGSGWGAHEPGWGHPFLPR